MIIKCNNCCTKYSLSHSEISQDGSLVCCTNCGNEWMQFYSNWDIAYGKILIRFLIYSILSLSILLLVTFILFFGSNSKYSGIYNVNDDFALDKFEFNLVDNNTLLIDGIISNTTNKNILLPNFYIKLVNGDKILQSFYINPNTVNFLNPGSNMNMSYYITPINNEFDRIIIDSGSLIDLMLRIF